jgi:adenylate cyclase
VQTTTRASQLLRRSAAVLNGDIADFSRLVADDVDSTIEDLERARVITEEAVADCSGTLVDFIGDNFMAVFPTAIGAVDAARRILDGLQQANSTLPVRRRLTFRMGISVGELVIDDSAVFGDAVNVAARVRDTVEPGGIAITGETLVRLDNPELQAEPLGQHRFKNIPEPVHVYRLSDTDQPGRPATSLSFRPRPCLSFNGVVPLLENDPVLDRTSRLLTLELRAELRKMTTMTLVTSEMGVPPAVKSLPAATHILEAWCDRDGGESRLYFELVDVSRWVPQWGERYAFAHDQLALHLTSIVNDVASAVDVNVVLGEYGRIYRSTLSAVAVARLHEAHECLIRGDADSLAAARRILEEMSRIEIHSADPPGLASFTCLLQVLLGYSDDPETDLAQAAAHAEEARRRGDTTGLPDMIGAQVLAWSGQTEEARIAADRSLAVRGTCDATYAVKASVMRYLGEWEDAVMLARRAIDLAPSTPPWYSTVLASAYFVGERYESVIDAMEPVAAAGAADAEGMLLLAASQQGLEMTRNARATLAAFRQRFPRLHLTDAVKAHPFVNGAVCLRWLAFLEEIEG